MRTIFRHELARSEWRGLTAMALGLALATLGPVAASSADPSPAPSQSVDDKWTSWLELGGYDGTDNHSRSRMTAFTPSVGSGDALLFDSGKLFEKDVQQGNLALGYRQMVPSGRNFRVRSGFDQRNTNANNAFWQVSDGLRYGFDGKIGVRLFGGNVPDDKAIFRPGELWIYGGGLRFNGDGALSDVTGPNLRAEWRFHRVIEELPGSRLTLEGEFSNDRSRDDIWGFGLRLRIPFGGPNGNRSISYTSL